MEFFYKFTLINLVLLPGFFVWCRLERAQKSFTPFGYGWLMFTIVWSDVALMLFIYDF